MAKRLSDRAIEILCVIRERTKGDLYWLPGGGRGRDDSCEELAGSCANISGAGDGRILRSLRERGLTRRPKGCTMPTEYAYQITEDGILAIEQARESGRLESIREGCRRRQRVLDGYSGH